MQVRLGGKASPGPRLGSTLRRVLAQAPSKSPEPECPGFRKKSFRMLDRCEVEDPEPRRKSAALTPSSRRAFIWTKQLNAGKPTQNSSDKPKGIKPISAKNRNGSAENHAGAFPRLPKLSFQVPSKTRILLPIVSFEASPLASNLPRKFPTRIAPRKKSEITIPKSSPYDLLNQSSFQKPNPTNFQFKNNSSPENKAYPPKASKPAKHLSLSSYTPLELSTPPPNRSSKEFSFRSPKRSQKATRHRYSSDGSRDQQTKAESLLWKKELAPVSVRHRKWIERSLRSELQSPN